MKITEIQRFCMHDGPGVRTVVFFKGCPLSCAWCHNPETQATKQELLFYQKKCIGCRACERACKTHAHRFENGTHEIDRTLCNDCAACAEVCCTKALAPAYTNKTEADILRDVQKDFAFYGKTGGVTLSGGEPLMQPDEVLNLLKALKSRKLNTAVETCGFFRSDILPRLVPFVDLFLWDFKDSDDERHKKFVGVSNTPIIENLLHADRLGANTVLRCIMISGVNMQKKHYKEIAALWHRLKHCRYVELLPYHAYGGAKAVALGRKDNGNIKMVPSKEELSIAADYLKACGVKIKSE